MVVWLSYLKVTMVASNCSCAKNLFKMKYKKYQHITSGRGVTRILSTKRSLVGPRALPPFSYFLFNLMEKRIY